MIFFLLVIYLLSYFLPNFNSPNTLSSILLLLLRSFLKIVSVPNSNFLLVYDRSPNYLDCILLWFSFYPNYICCFLNLLDCPSHLPKRLHSVRHFLYNLYIHLHLIFNFGLYSFSNPSNFPLYCNSFFYPLQLNFPFRIPINPCHNYSLSLSFHPYLPWNNILFLFYLYFSHYFVLCYKLISFLFVCLFLRFWLSCLSMKVLVLNNKLNPIFSLSYLHFCLLFYSPFHKWFSERYLFLFIFSSLCLFLFCHNCNICSLFNQSSKPLNPNSDLRSISRPNLIFLSPSQCLLVYSENPNPYLIFPWLCFLSYLCRKYRPIHLSFLDI